MAVEGAAPSPGAVSRLGKYEIIAKIGQGAMGEVFKARDTVLERFVAIKTMSAAVLGDPDLGQRFLREAQSAARLNHPNVVTLHEFGEDAGRFFMAMELLEGEDLKGVLKRGGLASLDDKLAVMEQILDGVAYAHAAGVVHRDLKPPNIHVQANGRVKVMDFGLARFGDSEMTRAGTVMGSPNYMSPEQVRGERAGPYSDVFSLGAVFYEVIGGRRAFDADSMHAVLYKVTDSDPVPLTDWCQDLPQIIEVFIRKALAKEPELRYRDGTDMRDALEMCRRVLDGSLQEAAAIASLHEAPTMVRPTSDLDDTALKLEPPKAAGRSVPGSQTSVRRGTRSAATPPPTARHEPAAPTRLAAPPVAAPSRAPLHIGAIVVVLVCVIAGAFVLRRQEAAPVAPPVVDGQAKAVVSAAIAAHLDAARRSLEVKDLEGAVAASRKALQLDPGNVEAQEIAARVRASLDQAESLARAARDSAQADAAKQTARAAEAARRAPPSPVRSSAPPSAPTPAVVAAQPTPPSAALAVPAAPPPTLAPAPAPPVAAAVPHATPAPKPAVSDDALIRQLVATLKRSIEEKDLALYKELRPNLTAEDERRLKDAFRNVSSQQVDFSIDAIAVDGDKATVRVTRSGRVSGQSVPPVRQVLRLVRSDGEWTIAEIGQ